MATRENIAEQNTFTHRALTLPAQALLADFGPTHDGLLTNIRRNPAAGQTLGLLAEIHWADHPLTTAEIISQRHGGIYPTRTREEIDALEKVGLIKGEIDSETGSTTYVTTPFGHVELTLNDIQEPRFVENKLKEAYELLHSQPSLLPAEKYGNEEFRFTLESTYDLIKKMYRDNSYRRINMMVIGSPMIGIFMSMCPDIANSVTVFDINADIVRFVNQMNETNNNSSVMAAMYDARNPLPPTFKARYDTVVFDPPWHNEHYCLFADRAWDALRPLGKAYMSTFAPSTRPEAPKELSELYERFMAGGFDLTEITPQFFGYQIPEFERKAFEAQGIHVDSRGKYGQLVVIQKQPERSSQCLTDELKEKFIQEVDIELVMPGQSGNGTMLWIEVKTPEPKANEPLSITAVNDGNTYLTTSRSQRRSEHVSILTKDHVGYRCNSPKKLYHIYKAWSKDQDSEHIAQSLVNQNIYDNIADALRDVEVAVNFFATNL